MKLSDFTLRAGVDHTGISVVFFCHDGQGHFLMARRSEQARDERNRWDIGGGGLDYGADPLDQLDQEIFEEYRTHPLHSGFLGYRHVCRTLADGTPTHWIALDFAVQINPASASIGEPHKFSELGWFDLSTLPAVEDMHSQLPTFFDKYRPTLEALLTAPK